MFKRKELRVASIGDYVCMSPNKVETMIESAGYKKSSYTWVNQTSRNDYIRSHSFPQSVTQNNRINFEDAAILYYKGDSFFSKDVAEVIPLAFKNEGYNVSAGKDFARRNKSYFVNKEDLVILSDDSIKSEIKQISNWRCERVMEVYLEKDVITSEEYTKFMAVINEA